MWCLIAAEAAIFTIFVVAYIFYIGKSITGPQPKDVLHPPIFYTVCLLASSLTIHNALPQDYRRKDVGVCALVAADNPPGRHFPVRDCARVESTDLSRGASRSVPICSAPRITHWSACMPFHVTMGLLALLTVAIFYFTARLRRKRGERLPVLSMYWHFVDVVWVDCFFTVVYVIGV